jgi:galactokinase
MYQETVNLEFWQILSQRPEVLAAAKISKQRSNGTMTAAERVEKIKQAKELIEELLDDPEAERELGEELYKRLQESYNQVHRTYIRIKAWRSRQPLGVK